MKVALGSDHGGKGLKDAIKTHLEKANIEVSDFGTKDATSCDYPDFALPVAQKVAQGDYDLGIICCGTGIGVSMVANKVKGVRAALCHDTFSAHASREHNNANVLCMGERVIGLGLALDIVDTWLHTSFEGGRHERRVEKMMALDDERYA